MGERFGSDTRRAAFVTGTHGMQATNRFLTTVLFLDIVGSTERAAQLGDTAWLALLRKYYDVSRQEFVRFRGREVNSAGDGLLATFDGPARAIRCAWAIGEKIAPMGIEVRAGVHTGECELIDKNVGGIAVHVGSRVMAHAGANEVIVSSTVKDLVAGSGLRFESRGVHVLKGVPGKWRLYAVKRAAG